MQAYEFSDEEWARIEEELASVKLPPETEEQREEALRRFLGRIRLLQAVFPELRRNPPSLSDEAVKSTNDERL